MIADIAFVFHWSLTELDNTDWDDLLAWHRLAMERFEIQMKMALPHGKL